jgi:hypothetical protein
MKTTAEKELMKELKQQHKKQELKRTQQGLGPSL